MFSYYGSKSKISKYYPTPTYDLIIEPFAGAGNYSLLHYKNHSVWLNDKYTVIFKLWKHLQTLDLSEIESIPQLNKGDDIRNLDLSEGMKLILGFSVNCGVATPHNIYTDWAQINNLIKQSKNRLLKYYERIKSWKITNLDYNLIPNEEATWFIDPPYMFGGNRYKESKIDYIELANWCKTRKGQVIVCENSNANWLDFKPLVRCAGQKTQTLEVVWTNR